MHTDPEKWDYVITGKPYGITRMVLVGIIAGLFIVLTLDQLRPGPHKMSFIALAFGGIATLMTVIMRMGMSFRPRTLRQFFHFTDQTGKKYEALLEGTLNDPEITILITRIDHAQKEI